MMHKQTKALAQAGKIGLRKGLTIIELSIGLVIVGIIVIAAFTGYNKIYIPSKADAEYKKITSIISGLERSRTLNGGVYPSYTGAITLGTHAKLVNALGGAASIKDIIGYAYTCAPTTSGPMTIVTVAIDDATVGALLVELVQSANSGWTAVYATNKVTLTKTNNVCQV